MYAVARDCDNGIVDRKVTLASACLFQKNIFLN